MISKPAITFEVLARDGEARTGLITTRRGVIETPVFMPVGTAGTVKGVRFEALESELDTRIILGNTYHLWLRPGVDVIRTCGGLHQFTSWQRALLTDSGGFQVWSLGAMRKITEEGTAFRSHLDGSLQFLSPEISMEVQAALGAEIVMAFDECAAGDAAPEVARESLQLTARWAKRSRAKFDSLQSASSDAGRTEPTEKLSGEQALFGIVQGGAHLDLRRESESLHGWPWLRAGAQRRERARWRVVSEIGRAADPLRYHGRGHAEDLVEAIARGIVCLTRAPTRNGRTGQAFPRHLEG